MTRDFPRFWRSALLALLPAVCLAADAVSPPSGGTPVLPAASLAALQLAGSQRDLGTLEQTAQEGTPVARLSTRSGATTEWNLQAVVDPVAEVKKGDAVLIRFKLRCTESITGEGSLGVVYEQNAGEYLKAVEMRVGAPREWAPIAIPFKATRDYPASGAQLALRLGYDRQTIEIMELEVLNYGSRVKLEDLPRTRVTYAGREPDAPWRAAAEARIERIRKGDLSIAVVDAAGKPIPGATVDARLTRHAFPFGTAVNADWLVGTSPDHDRYRQYIESHFNSAVFGNEMKWYSTWNGVSPKTDQALAWLLDRQIRVRGHTVLWPSWRWSPKPLEALKDNPAALRERVNGHIDSIVGHFKGKLPQWDVVNEPYSERDLITALGGDAVMVDWFKRAHAADPSAQLFVNDYGIFDAGRRRNAHADHFYNTIRYLKDNGAPLGGIGIQSHFTSELPPPEALLATLDRFSALGLPIESTEVSLDIDDRPLQADYLRDYMITLFSHPNVTGITLWGFWPKDHWRPQGALVADDWTLRPHGVVFSELMHKTWMTQATLTTDAAGHAKLRGFRGAYRLEVKTPDGRSRTVTAAIGAEPTPIQVVVE